MKRTEQIVFPPFRLDPDNEQLWRENQLVAMPPKTFAVLRFLVEHAGQLVTKEALLNGVWPDSKVSEGILKGYIHDLRDILEDDAQEPRFIKTVLRRGYRFVGSIVSNHHSGMSSGELTSVRGPASEVCGCLLYTSPSPRDS